MSQRFWLYFLCVTFAAATTTRALSGQSIVINEIFAAGENPLTDEDGDDSDWFECHNSTPDDIALGGWFATDDPLTPQKWQFPNVTLPAGGYLVVFASGKDRDDPNGEIHTSFKLASEGEHLAILRPNGDVEHMYDPFPALPDGVSFGLSGEVATLIPIGAAADIVVPTSGVLGLTWTEVGFAPDASWATGPTGIGYHTGGESLLPAPLSSWTLDGTVADVVGPNDGTFVGGAANYVEGFDGSSGTALDFDGSDDYIDVSTASGLPIYDSPAFTIAMWVKGGPQNDKRVFSEGSSSNNTPLFTIGTDASGNTGKVDIFVRSNGSTVVPHRLSQGIAFDNTWHHIAWVDEDGDAALYIDGELDGQNFSYSKPALDLDITSIGSVLRASACCFFNGQIDDVGIWDLALTAEEIAALASGAPPDSGSLYAPLVATDVESELRGNGTSLYARIPFDVADAGAITSLSLGIQYDDGFAAYLNGTEVVRRNAPGALAWDSAATAERSDAAATVVDEINLTPFAASLRDGANVLAIHALNRTSDDPSFLLRPRLVASGASATATRFFGEPSPGAANTGGAVDFVQDTKFTVDRGFFDAPFNVEITTATPDATIRYTTDGTAPTATHGDIYDGPIAVTTTTTLRAAGFKDGFEPTNVDTHTYIFLDDVLAQPNQRPGYPSTWQGFPADYGMDPEVTTDVDSPNYHPGVKDALASLPTMSLVLAPNDLMGGSGIYTNSLSRGSGWERSASIELILPEGMLGPEGNGREFQVNCGVRMQGGSSARPGEGKHSFRLLFKDEHGPTKLRFGLFPDSRVDRFDTVILRCFSTDSWHFKDGGARYRRWDSQFIRDLWMKDTQLAMGHLSGHNSYVHLYVNGFYWGVYNPSERPDDSFLYQHDQREEVPQSTRKEDWDVVKDFNELFRGNRQAWDQLMSLANSGLSSVTSYQRLQGNNPDGTRNPAYPVLLDVDNLIDYMMLHLYGCAEDWPHHNWYAGRSRTADSRGWRFFVWDQEIVLDFVFRDRLDVSNSNSPAFVYSRLRANEEFRVRFGDRIQRHLFHEGVLTNDVARARWNARADQIDSAVIAESARWGDYRMDVADPRNSPAELYTREDHWLVEKEKVLNTYLPESHRRAMTRFRRENLYPAVDPPILSQHGGVVARDFPLGIAAPLGTAYYTLDGSDPRLEGGEVSPTAIAAGVGATETILGSPAPARYLVPSDDSVDSTWTAVDFPDDDWTAGESAIGYERSSGYEDDYVVDLEGEMYGLSPTVYLRIPFDVADPSQYAFLRLEIQYDDGFVAYLNGEEIAQQNAPADLSYAARADDSHPDADAQEFLGFDLTGAASLRAGRNVLAIHGLNASATSSDFLIAPRLVGGSLAESAIPIESTSVVKARSLQGGEWSALVSATFYLDEPLDLRITEVHYHPRSEPGSPFNGDDFEFVEMQNVGPETIALTGVRLSGAIEFQFPTDEVWELAPGETVLVVENFPAFTERYDTNGMFIAGEYRGNLSNGGEWITLESATGELILEFAYDDEWYPSTDGAGSSLEIVNALGPASDWLFSAAWAPSAVTDGTPGEHPLGPPPDGGLQLIGDGNQDGNSDISDAVATLLLLFGGGDLIAPCDGDSPFEGGNLVLLDINADGGFNVADAVHLLNYLFGDGDPPPLGSGCVRIPGCPNVCR